MSLRIELDADEGCMTVHVQERFDFSVHRAFHDACLDGQRAHSYVIDLEQATTMDSSALGMLLLLRERAGGEGADIRIVNAQPDLRNTLRVAGFEELFTVH